MRGLFAQATGARGYSAPADDEQQQPRKPKMPPPPPPPPPPAGATAASWALSRAVSALDFRSSSAIASAIGPGARRLP